MGELKEPQQAQPDRQEIEVGDFLAKVDDYCRFYADKPPLPYDPSSVKRREFYDFLQSKESKELLGRTLKQGRYFAPVVEKLSRMSFVGERWDDVIVKGFIAKFVEANISQLEKTLASTDSEGLRVAGLHLFTGFLEPDMLAAIKNSNVNHRIEQGLEVLERQFSCLQMALEHKLEGFDAVPLLKKILKYGKPPILNRVYPVVQEELKKGKYPDLFQILLHDHRDSDLYKPSKPLIEAQLTIYNTDPAELLSYWEICNNPTWKHKFPEIISQNLTTIGQVEKAKPGATRYLLETYGIRHFGRYPWEILVQQYDDDHLEVEKKAPHQAFILGSLSDNSGISYAKTRVFKQIAEQLKEKFPDQWGVKISEFGSKRGGLRRLNYLRKKFGPAFLGLYVGHGNPFALQMDEKSGHLTLSDLQRSGASALRLAFTKNATIILCSCSTGVETVDPTTYQGNEKELAEKFAGQEGFSKTLSRVTGLRILSPKVDTSGIQSVTIDVNSEGKPELETVFWEKSQTEYVAGNRIL